MDMINFTPEEPTNSTTQIFEPLDILNIFTLLFGLPTHSYIIWLIVTATRSGVASGFFNLNLSVCEIGICLNSLIFLLETWTPFNIIKNVRIFFVGLGISGRPLFQCLICVERYLAVVHPVTFLKYKPLRYRVICCSVAWIITLAACLVCNFTKDLLYIFSWFYSLQFLLLLSIQLFCLVSVLRALKQSGPGDRKREEENHMKRRAFYLILITTVSTTAIYMPFTVSGFLYVVTERYTPNIFTIGLSFFLLAGFVQPVLYLNRVGKLTCFSVLTY